MTTVVTLETMSSDAPAEGMTIDDLAAQTRVPSRTIRFYQSKGALIAHPRSAGASPTTGRST